MGIKLDKEPLTVEPDNYLTKILNVYIVYNLDAWPKICILLVLMEALVTEKKFNVNFSKANIIMLIIVICLLMEMKYLNLRPIIKM